MDGLLLDTERIYASATFLAARELGYAPSRDFCASLAGLSDDECDARLREELGTTFKLADFLAAYERHKARDLTGGPPVKPGARELLRHCSTLGVPIALVTSARRPTAESHLDETGLTPFFTAIITRDDVALPKPAPDPFRAAAAALGIAVEDCLAFEDSGPGIASASTAGMPVVLVPDLVMPDPALLDRCAAILSSLSEAVDLLGG
jgi:HAD superfamily hydrolase (TIGR01509 family)